jgi:hypothetical protein
MVGGVLILGHTIGKFLEGIFYPTRGGGRTHDDVVDEIRVALDTGGTAAISRVD